MAVSATSSRQKHFGAFYTPPAMAAALVDWAIRTPDDTVLDPSFGGLAFLGAAHDRLRRLGSELPDEQLFGVDLDDEAFAEAQSFARGGATLAHEDFLLIEPGSAAEIPRVNAVVGNPPYVRYQQFKQSREWGREIARKRGVRLTRLASSWAPLLMHAADFVAPGGRLAQVLPAELIHAQYATDVLASICQDFERVVVAMFDEHVFVGAQEEVVLLFADGRGDGPAPGVEMLSFRNLDALDVPDAPGVATPPDAEHKLLAGLLPERAIELYDSLVASDLTRRLGHLASVDIGAVTGANDFFVRPARDVDGLPAEAVRPAVSKATHVAGARFAEADLTLMDERGTPGRMLVFEAKHHEHPAVRRLIKAGEARELHERYKCRIRDPWWVLPARQVASPPHLFLTYMAADVPRLVSNEAGALSTNTVHGVRLHNGTNPAGLAASFYTSLTMLSAELVGRSYGGGVLKLEPTEAERLVVARPSAGHAKLLDKVDSLVRERRYDELSAHVDEAVLVSELGISAADVAVLRNAAQLLRERRRTRATHKAG